MREAVAVVVERDPQRERALARLLGAPHAERVAREPDGLRTGRERQRQAVLARARGERRRSDGRARGRQAEQHLDHVTHLDRRAEQAGQSCPPGGGPLTPPPRRGGRPPGGPPPPPPPPP